MNKVVMIAIPYGQAKEIKSDKDSFLEAIKTVEDFIKEYNSVDKDKVIARIVETGRCPLDYAYMAAILYGQATIAKDMTKDEMSYVNSIVSAAINTIIKINKSLCNSIDNSISEFNKISDNRINETIEKLKDIPTELLEEIIKERKFEIK